MEYGTVRFSSASRAGGAVAKGTDAARASQGAAPSGGITFLCRAGPGYPDHRGA